MAYRIVVSERAEKNLDEIVAYLRKEWSKRISDQYNKEDKIQIKPSVDVSSFLYKEGNSKVHH